MRKHASQRTAFPPTVQADTTQSHATCAPTFRVQKRECLSQGKAQWEREGLSDSK